MKPRLAFLLGLSVVALLAALPRLRAQDPGPGDPPPADQPPAATTPAVDQVEKEAKAPFGITVQGEVTRPGHYTITADYTVIDAIDLAGGFTPKSLRSKVTVLRRVNGGAQVGSATLDYTDSPPNPANADFKLRAGDVISIPADPTYGK